MLCKSAFLNMLKIDILKKLLTDSLMKCFVKYTFFSYAAMIRIQDHLRAGKMEGVALLRASRFIFIIFLLL